MHDAIRNLPYNNFGAYFFWCDDNSNYAGMYLTGPLTNYICFLDHHDVNLSPVYPSLIAFVQQQLEAANTALAWYKMPTTYPRLNRLENPKEAAEEWEIVQRLNPLFAQAADEFDREQYAFMMMALTPVEHTDAILLFLDDKDLYIQERACQIIGLRKYEAAIAALAHTAQDGFHNAKMAAILALGHIHTPASQVQLEVLRQQLPESYRRYLDAALGVRGGDIIHEGKTLRFRMPSATAES